MFTHLHGDQRDPVLLVLSIAMALKLVEIAGYSLAPIGRGKGLQNFDCSISEGDVIYVEGDHFDDSHLFLRALAALEKPQAGVFYYRGHALDFSDYRKLLPYKRKVGYLSADATLLSNRTIGENIMWQRYYLEGRKSLKVVDEVLYLCRIFGIEDKLDLRPSQVFRDEVRAAIIIRELIKGAEILLVEPARDTLSRVHYDSAVQLTKEFLSRKVTAVFSFSDEAFIREAATKKVRIIEGKLEVITLR
jgi:ABC-type ATPase involved in cell division